LIAEEVRAYSRAVPVWRKAVKILLADNDPESLENLTELVQDLGHRPETAGSAPEALQTLHGREVDLAILDWSMPDLPASEALGGPEDEEMPAPYTIILTGEDSSEDVVSALEGGADDFVAKPVDPDELRARIRVGVRTVRLEAELRKLNRKLSVMARTDSMTGLLNHTAILRELDTELRRASRKRTPTSVLLLDLDHFKQVNDTWGHQAGDQVLKRFAMLIDEESRSYDKTGRYGGEEFLLVLPETGPEECATIAERIRTHVERMDLTEVEDELTLTTSVGGSTCDGTDIDVTRLISLADNGLYRAKEEGRNRVCIEQPEV
jgi:diguanylate cyclase (GGDEF)-like protein